MKRGRKIFSSVFLLFFFFWVGQSAAQQDVRALREEIRKVREESERKIRELEEKMEKMEKDTSGLRGLVPGFENMLLTGYAQANYNDERGEGNPGSFNAGFNPVFLWSLGENFLFEAELEFELEERDTETNLEYAQIHYILNDYITIGAGKFLGPFDIFQERLHPTWINKLPTAPLPFGHHGGLAPTQEFGFQIRGAVPLWGEAKSNFAFYVSNGPTLVTSGHHAGELRFGNADDNNNNKAVGGRVGFLPIPELEVGVSYQHARAGDGPGFRNVDADLFGGDISYVRNSEMLKGNIDLRFEYVQQRIDRATYTVDMVTYRPKNHKTGWYTQLAYRPSGVDIPILKDIEGVFRYTGVNWPTGTPWGGGVDRNVYSFGLNYLLKPNAILKLGYDLADNEGTANDDDTFKVQLTYGF